MKTNKKKKGDGVLYGICGANDRGSRFSCST